MDFAHLIKDQNSKISDSSPYLEALWARATRNADYNLENRTIERKIFLDHLPLNLQLFLDDCIQKVQEEIDATNTINWSAIKTKYLKSFLYWCLVCGEEQGNLVPLSAAQLYFMLNTLAQQQNNFFVESIYSAALNAIQQTICYDNIPTQTQGVIDQLREFLKRNNLTKPALMNTVSVLNKIIDLDSQRTFNQFDSDAPSHCLEHAAFICFKVLLGQLQENYKNNKEIILFALFNLMCLQTRQKGREAKCALQYNTKHFLKCVYNYETVAQCPVLAVMKTLTVHRDFDQYDEMVSVLCDLHYNVYSDFCWWVAEALISNRKEYRMYLPNVTIQLVAHTHSSQTQEKKDLLVEMLMLNLIKLCADDNLDIAEGALRNLEIVFNLNDSRNAAKNLIEKDHEAILHTIAKHIDKKWKQKNTNRHFVNVICRFSAFQRNILNPKLMKEIDDIFSEACPMDLRPCMNNLADLLKCSSNQPHVANVILKFFVRMTLSPVGLSNIYGKAFYECLFQSIEQNFDSSDSLNIADLLISQHYEHKEVFKKFHSQNLLMPHKLKVLINYKVTDNPKALKLICALLDFIEYKHFEELANFTRRTFQQKTYNHADMLFYALEKILAKIARPAIPADLQFLEELLNNLESEIRLKNLPVNCSSNAIGLLLKLGKTMKKDLQIHHIVTELETSFYNKLLKIAGLEEVELFEICRDISYLGDFLLLTDEVLGERTVVLLHNVLKIHDERAMTYLNSHADIWSLLVAFFTKLSLKHEQFVEENILILENALISESEYVRYHALVSLEDLCSFRLNYFQPLVPHVFKFIQEDKTTFFVIVCVRIINQLINEDYILLDEQQYVALTSMLAHKNDYIRMQTEKILYDSFLLKCKQTIAKFFVPSILYYNKYKHHPVVFVSDDSVLFGTLTAMQRKRIYKFLFDSLATAAQFNVVHEMTTEILTRILDGHLIRSGALLVDCVAIVELFLPHLGEDAYLTRRLQEKLMKEIKSIVEKKRTVVSTKHHDYQVVIKKLLVTLLHLTFQIQLVDSSLRPDLIKIVMRTTKVLLSEITKLVLDGSEELRKLYSKFIFCYEKHKHSLRDEDPQEFDIISSASSSM